MGHIVSLRRCHWLEMEYPGWMSCLREACTTLVAQSKNGTVENGLGEDGNECIRISLTVQTILEILHPSFTM
jgi:hypothetical protein